MKPVITPSERAAITIASLLIAVAGCAAVGWWITRDATASFSISHADMDDPVGAKKAWLERASTTRIGDQFAKFDGAPSNLPGLWPHFRGPDYNNIAPNAPPLNTTWPEAGPPVLWKLDLGEGQAAAAVRNGRVYVLDFIEAKRADALRCFSLDDGREIWRRSYKIEIKRNHGYSRSIPAVTDEHVVTIGPRNHVMCVDAVTGDLRWTLDLGAQFGSIVPDWHGSQCPIIDDGIAVIAPVGTNIFMMGIHCSTGEVAWKTPAIEGWKMAHSSITPGVVAGKRQYIYAAVGGIAGVSAEPEDRGKLLWTSDEWTPNVVAPSPVIIGENRVYTTAGYGTGGAIHDIERDGDTFTATLVTRYRPTRGISSEQQTPLFYNGRLYSIMPKDSGGYKNQFVAAGIDGKITWSSGGTVQFGIGPILVADNKFWILDDDGGLTVGVIENDQWKQLAKARVLQGVDSWGPITLAGTRMILRDSHTMICLDLSTTRQTARIRPAIENLDQP